MEKQEREKKHRILRFIFDAYNPIIPKHQLILNILRYLIAIACLICMLTQNAFAFFIPLYILTTVVITLILTLMFTCIFWGESAKMHKEYTETVR